MHRVEQLLPCLAHAILLHESSLSKFDVLPYFAAPLQTKLEPYEEQLLWQSFAHANDELLKSQPAYNQSSAYIVTATVSVPDLAFHSVLALAVTVPTATVVPEE